MKYQTIESLGLKVVSAIESGIPLRNPAQYVRASDLETLLQSAQRVFGHVNQGKPNYWGPRENGQFDDTHMALIIGITEIKREPIKKVFELRSDQNLEYKLEDFKGKRVRVTVEEIESEPS